MTRYAFLNHIHLVVDVIEGSDDRIEGVDAAEWYGNLRNMACVKADDSAGIGMGYRDGVFIPKPHEGAIWNGKTWLPSLENRVEALEETIEKLLAQKKE